MARTVSIKAIDSRIERLTSEMRKAQETYDTLVNELEELKKKKRDVQSKTIMKAFLKSNRTFEEVINFLNPM
mgnify:FL=1